MVYYKNKTKNMIVSTYDEKCVKPVIQNKTKIGVGCVICDPAPIYCPYFDKGVKCICDELCDIYNTYQPTKIYKNKQNVIEHLHTHNIQISENILEFYFS